MFSVPEVDSGARTVLFVDLVDELLLKLPPSPPLLLLLVDVEVEVTMAVSEKLNELFDGEDPAEVVALYGNEDPIFEGPALSEDSGRVTAEEFV